MEPCAPDKTPPPDPNPPPSASARNPSRSHVQWAIPARRISCVHRRSLPPRRQSPASVFETPAHIAPAAFLPPPQNGAPMPYPRIACRESFLDRVTSERLGAKCTSSAVRTKRHAPNTSALSLTATLRI